MESVRISSYWKGKTGTFEYKKDASGNIIHINFNFFFGI